MDYWMRSNPGKNVTIYEIPALVKKAQLAAMTPKNICLDLNVRAPGHLIGKFLLN